MNKYYIWTQYFLKGMFLHRNAVLNKTEKAFGSAYIRNELIWSNIYSDYAHNQGKNNSTFFNALKLMLPIIVISPENVVDHKLLKQFREDFPNYAYIANEIEEKNNLFKDERV